MSSGSFKINSLSVIMKAGLSSLLELKFSTIVNCISLDALIVPTTFPFSEFSMSLKFWSIIVKLSNDWAWKAPEAPDIDACPDWSPRSTVPLVKSTLAAKIGESAAKSAPVSIRNNDSESAMLWPSPPIRKILLPKNSEAPPSPIATPLKNPSKLKADDPPNDEDSPNWMNDSSNKSGSE